MLEGGNMPPREGVQKISAHESLINDLALAASGSRR
jgi:hypothetical protein